MTWAQQKGVDIEEVDINKAPPTRLFLEQYVDREKTLQETMATAQRISEDGWQEALNNPLKFDHLPVTRVSHEGKPVVIDFQFPDRTVHVQVWEVRVGRVPLYLLDTNVDENSEYDRLLTARLYWSRWACPECGGTICVHRQVCYGCGQTVKKERNST